MKSIKKIGLVIILLPLFATCFAQIKNATTETVKIYGNCGICETAIENAGNLKKVAQVDWNKESKMATLTYDAKKTSRNAILKRIALAGYDSDEFLAPADAYAKLLGCCQYERTNLTVAKMENMDNMNTLPSDATSAITENEVPEIMAETMPEMDTILKIVEGPEIKPSEVKTEVITPTKTVEVVKNKPSETMPTKEARPKKNNGKSRDKSGDKSTETVSQKSIYAFV
jgi:hypothetical protein